MIGDPEREKLDEMAARIRQAEADSNPVKEAPPAATEAIKASRIGFDFVATILGCAGVGWLVDHFMGSGPWGVLGLVFVGFVVGMFNVWKALK